MQKLSKLDIISLVLGSVIGWGAFYLPGQKFLSQSGVVNTAIGFLIGWGLLYFIQMAYHIMIEQQKGSGGEFTYILNYLGARHGFISGWSLIFCYLTLIPLNASAVPLVIRSIAPQLIFGELYTVSGYIVYLSDLIISALVIMVFFWVNQKGLTLSMRLQKFLMFLLVVLVLVLSEMMGRGADKAHFQFHYLDKVSIDWTAISQVLAIIPFLFVGFDLVPQVLTDIGFNKKFVTRMTVLATGVGVLIYNLLNLLTAFAYSPSQAFDKKWASGQAVLDNLGLLGFAALTLALLAAIVGGINGFMIGSSRVVVALAEKKLLPPRFLNKNPLADVPTSALTFVSLIAMLMLLLGRVVILYIVELSSLMAAIIYLYVSYISSRLAKNTKEKWFSQVALAISLLFVALLILPGSPSQLSAVSFGILALWGSCGFIYYKIIRVKEKK